ncbi:MAG: hypothetical protein ABFC96_14995 [Thermoguttaceae bacterium]
MKRIDSLAKSFDLPMDSPEHRALRENAWLGGDYVECRYYLGALIGKNEFRTSEDEFLDDLSEFIARKTSPAARMFCCTINHCTHVIDFLRREFERQTGYPAKVKETKDDRAVELLLRHPDWSDEQIAAELAATQKTMARWVRFKYARRSQRFYEQKLEGWYCPRPTRPDRFGDQ